MKRILLLLVLISVCLYAQPDPRYYDSKDHTVMIDAEAIDNPSPAIRLTWLPNDLVESYTILRKDVESDVFTENDVLAQNLSAETLEYTDDSIEEGKHYEYAVVARSLGSFNTRTNEGQDTVVALPIDAWGYAACGYKAEERHTEGSVLVLVDEIMFTLIENELNRYLNDLELEGWHVIMELVERAEQFNGDAVISTKSTIMDIYKENPNITTLVLVGRVPVPYSGSIFPDGHPDHRGAWPADMYYGDINANWNDFQVNETRGSRPANHNVPGDGKFDVSLLQNREIELSVGRIDFYNMPLFDVEGEENSEAELLRRYFDKNHEYRMNMKQINRRALIDDNFPARNLLEGFAASGWRNFATLAGKDNVSKTDWFQNLSVESYMFAYGTGGGNYRGAGGVGSSTDFASQGSDAIFTFLFGSYFGDWDIDDAFMRAALASEPSILTCAWAGRPHWYIHHMGLGYPIGHGTTLSQNNGFEYLSVIYYVPNATAITSSNQMIHIALMGDPTLKMNMNYVPKPENVSAVENPDGTITITFDSPSEIEYTDYHFNVYRRIDDSPYQLANEEPIGVNADGQIEYLDNFLHNGTIQYAVRTAALETENTNSGSYYNLSHMEFAEVTTTDVTFNEDREVLNFGPNPANENVKFMLNLSNVNNVKIEIYNTAGNLIQTIIDKPLANGSHTLGSSLRDFSGDLLPPGVYIIKAKIGNDIITDKLIIAR